MMRFTISKLAQEFGLSRSTLLYYDRIGLLRSAGRTESGYRYYGPREYQWLKRICSYREAGLALREIKTILASHCRPSVKVLEARLHEIRLQMRDLQHQQHLLFGMVRQIAARGCPPTVDKALWVEMLRAAGMNEAAMGRWHTEFEKRNPQAHHEFLLSLGISETEAQQIRQWSAAGWKENQKEWKPSTTQRRKAHSEPKRITMENGRNQQTVHERQAGCGNVID